MSSMSTCREIWHPDQWRDASKWLDLSTHSVLSENTNPDIVNKVIIPLAGQYMFIFCWLTGEWMHMAFISAPSPDMVMSMQKCNGFQYEGGNFYSWTRGLLADLSPTYNQPLSNKIQLYRYLHCLVIWRWVCYGVHALIQQPESSLYILLTDLLPC